MSRSESYEGFDTAELTEWMQDFIGKGDKDKAMYVNRASGETILIFGSFAHWNTDRQKYLSNSLFVSADGKTFRQMESTGFGGSSGKHRRSYEDPATQKYYRMFFEGDIYTRFELESRDMPLERVYDDFEHFVSVKVDIPEDAVFIPVPEVRVPEYLYQMPNGEYIYVDAVKYGYAYEHLRLFTGAPDAMVQAEITDFARFRDGGTTVIHTIRGSLYAPFVGNEAIPLWTDETGHDTYAFLGGKVESGEELVRLDRTEAENLALIGTFSLQTA